jgi:hypothetical protein
MSNCRRQTRRSLGRLNGHTLEFKLPIWSSLDFEKAVTLIRRILGQVEAVRVQKLKVNKSQRTIDVTVDFPLKHLAKIAARFRSEELSGPKLLLSPDYSISTKLDSTGRVMVRELPAAEKCSSEWAQTMRARRRD